MDKQLVTLLVIGLLVGYKVYEYWTPGTEPEVT